MIFSFSIELIIAKQVPYSYLVSVHKLPKKF